MATNFGIRENSANLFMPLMLALVQAKQSQADAGARVVPAPAEQQLGQPITVLTSINDLNTMAIVDCGAYLSSFMTLNFEEYT